MRKFTGVLALLPLLAAAPAVASDHPRPARAAIFHNVKPGEAVGCYWDRGRQFCGNYCYWEVNGRRYCQKREEIALPQGAWIDGYLLDEGRSTINRRPYSRVRRATRGPAPW